MADRTLTINHADGGSETYTINRDKFAGVREMSRGHVYPTIASTDFDLTGVVFTKVDEETFTLVTNNSTDTRYVVFVNHENGIRTGKHRLAFDLTLNSGSLGTITGFYTDFDGDPSNGGSYGSYSLTEGSNVIDFEIFDDGVGASPEIIWAINTGSTFDISVTNLKVTHEPDTVTVDHTAVPKEQSKETTFGGSQSITIKREIEPLLSEVVGGASAAYSLRDLNDKAGNSKVVRVRRASDNCERDFRANEVEDIATWVNTQTVPPLDLQELDADGHRTGDLVEAAAAYSLRNLSASYTGNVVEVRRSSDDAEESFTAAEVADGTLVAWVGAGNDGFVSQWYDQSGNGNHATQGTPASQPKIVDGGSLVADGIDFDGVDDRLTCPSLYSSDISIFNVATTSNTVNTGNFMRMIHLCDGSDSFQLTRGGLPETGKLMSKNTAFQSGTTAFKHGDINGVNLISAITSSTDTDAYIDGSLQSNSTDTLGFGNSATTTIGARDDLLSSSFFAGSHAELIIYNSDQSDNRTAIEANIGDHYDIDLPSGVDTGYDQVNGFVETWYDQSGNGNDATQETAGYQPKIVDGGVLVERTINGASSPSIKFTANNKMKHGLTSLSADGQQSLFLVSDNQLTANVSTRLIEIMSNTGDEASRRRPLMFNDINSSLVFSVDTLSGLYRTSSQSNFVSLYSSITEDSGGGTHTAYQDGSQFGSVSVTLDANPNIDLNSRRLGNIAPVELGAFFFTEVIYYPTDQSANRTAIEANINNQYDIY